MQTVLNLVLLLSLSVIPLISYAQANDPMGLSEYVARQLGPDGQWSDRRLTNHEVGVLTAVGEILPDGSVKQHPYQGGHGVGSQIARSPMAAPNPSTQPQGSKLEKLKASNIPKTVTRQNPSATNTAKGQGKTKQIVKRPLPTKHEIAKKTKTKPKGHPNSKGTVHVRPTNFPPNPTEEDIIRMQQHIQHIERSVGKALDLSLSAYAVAELPQATEGRSGVSVGFAANDGKNAEALGFSSNFGNKHEYTININLTHSGHEDAAGAGFGWQW